jgi:DNA replication and repair protein RecF
MQGSRNSLQLTNLHIKNFRCFAGTTVAFDAPIVLVQGNNGSGKTSLLEALHYLCYLRSFRTHTPRDLIQAGAEGFFIKASFDQQIEHQLFTHHVQVGFSGKKRLVKMNEQSVSSYKELIDHYRIITLTEDDLQLINLGPDTRRAFIDQGILLHDPEFISVLKAHKSIVDNRNKLLMIGSRDKEAFAIWTCQLWETATKVQEKRIQFLARIEQEVNDLLAQFFAKDQLSIAFTYGAKKMGHATFDEFLAENADLHAQEVRFGRSLFGAHLDDFAIKFQDRKSKSFASRGQQKLIIVLIKIAQIKQLGSLKGPAVFLLDDFMTDFDSDRAQTLMDILKGLESQLIFTSPLAAGAFEQRLTEQGAQRIALTI